MNRLRDLQVAFAEAVLYREQTGIEERIAANGLAGARRLQIYRNNVFGSLTDALRDAYPVVHRLVGSDFFHFAAERYSGDYPSHSGNLHRFGEYFARFLESFPFAAELPYLPDVARLEWAYHRVFHAPFSVSRLDLQALNGLSPARWGEVKFTLHPARALLASKFPVLRIWEVNQDDFRGDDTVALDEGEARLLILRPALTVELYPLSVGEFALLEALSAERDIATAYEQAAAREPGFDLAACLNQHIAQGVLVGWHLESFPKTLNP